MAWRSVTVHLRETFGANQMKSHRHMIWEGSVRSFRESYLTGGQRPDCPGAVGEKDICMLTGYFYTDVNGN